MKVIPKLQQGNTIESDNTKVVRPEIHEPIKAKPRQYSIVDLGGEPSNDTRSAAERNRDYWHPIKGAKARFKASMSNETNPLVGIERTILPSAAGAALVTTPAAVVGGALGNMTVDKLTGGWGNWLEDKTGIPSEIGIYTNPGAWYGGAKGYKIGKDKLITKSIKGDADLAWNPINKNHWIFNKEARTPSNIAMATANRITPFLSKVEKLPLKVAAYKAAKRTNGNASVSLQDIKTMPADYTGSSILGGGNLELVTMAHGGRFDFKKSPLLKKQEEINGKRDMRKKFIKSSRPTYKKRIKKAQQGMRFVSYNPVSNPTIDYTDITNPINPFSEYNYNTTYDKPEALVVPVRDTNEPDVVANNPTVEPVINKPVASKPVTDKPVTANSTWKSPYTNRKQWSTELINAYKKAGITNDNAIRMLLAQDALESSWGKSAQGKYNFGNLTTGSSWKGDYVTGNDKNAKGEAIKQKFRSYNSMDEYAADKIQFLKRLYDFDENDDINKFVAKLTGSNKGKRRYAEAKEYANSLRGVYNSFKAGGIIKYQEPAQPINRRDAIRDYRPNIPNRIRKATPAEHIQSMINIYGQSEQPTVTSDAKSPWQHQQAHEAASKGYDDYMQAKKYEEGLHNLNGILTFTDYATLATGLGSLLNKGVSYAGKRLIKKEIRNAMSTSGSPIKGSAAKFNISKESLPDYAKPNWQGDELALTKERLANGGFDRLEQFSKYSGEKAEQFRNATGMGYRDFYPFENDFGKTYRQYLLDSQPAKGTRADFKVNKEVAAFSDRTQNVYTTILDDVPDRFKNPQYRTTTEAHEFAHFAFNPQRRPPLDVYNPPLTNPHREYLLGLKDRNEYGTELTARGTQIKNYFGLDKDKPITEDMLKYAADNYVKDKGFDNNMTDFFSGIKNYKEMAKWLSELSPMLALPLLNY